VQSLTLKRLLRRLRHLRDVHGLTQEAFAEMSGIAYKYYQQIEAGRKPDLRMSTLERLANAYGIEVYELLAPELPKTKMIRRCSKNPLK
jgi:transcriptional regulator with XRE-family HTH domain